MRTIWPNLWSLLAAASLLTAVLQAQDVTAAEVKADEPSRPEISGRRIVKHFDFNEAPLGNFENLPMHWRRHKGVGFKPLLEGEFDREVGHLSAPSFRLKLDGGSLAYHYPDPDIREGRDIAVRTNSDYLLVAYLKTQGLTEARAYVTAYYLDRKGFRIPGTERRSRLIGGAGGATDWEPVTVALPGGVAGSRYIGISLWLTQSTVWNKGARPKRHIERVDIDATAWFDDMTVYRLPRVTLQTSKPGNAFDEHESVLLLTDVNDPDGLHLSAKLEIRDADKRIVGVRDDIPVHMDEHTASDEVTFNDLPVGFYYADLTVSTGQTVLVHRSLQFVRVSECVSPPTEMGRGFGVTLRQTDADFLSGQRQLLQCLHPEYVKVPIWYAQPAVLAGAVPGSHIDLYLESVVEVPADPIGIMMDDPLRERPTDGTHVPTMVEIFSEDASGWKPFIAGQWTRYAGLIHVWQLGNDGDRDVFLDDRSPQMVELVQREMRSLMSEPLLALPASTNYDHVAIPEIKYDTVTLESAVPVDGIAEHLRPFLAGDRYHLWVKVDPLDSKRYPREARLADLARRLVEVYHQHVGGVFLSAPWNGVADLLNPQVNPTEEYIILRTVADVIGGSSAVSRTSLNGAVECLVFNRDGWAILFVWDEYAPPGGREHVMLLGEDAEQVDLWGRRTKLRTIGNRQVVRIGRMPKFIIHTPTWMVEFRRKFQVRPDIFEASFDAEQREIAFTNTHHDSISGMLRLVVPPDWDIRPNKMSFVLAPGEEFRESVSIRYPLNAEAGVHPIVGDFDIDADRKYRIMTPAWFELGLEDIELDTCVFHRNDDVVIRVTLTNQSPNPVSFDGQLLAPGRSPINRLFASFKPGQSLTKDFVLKDAEELSGQLTRIGLKEVRGSRFWNRLVRIP
jgi:hypothetical protein